MVCRVGSSVIVLLGWGCSDLASSRISPRNLRRCGYLLARRAGSSSIAFLGWCCSGRTVTETVLFEIALLILRCWDSAVHIVLLIALLRLRCWDYVIVVALSKSNAGNCA